MPDGLRQREVVERLVGHHQHGLQRGPEVERAELQLVWAVGG
jgi:hypothetical protein